MARLILAIVLIAALLFTIMAIFKAVKRRASWQYIARILLFHWTGVMALYFAALAGFALLFEVIAWLVNGEFFDVPFHYAHNCWVWDNIACKREIAVETELLGLNKLIQGFLNWHASPVFYVWGWLLAAYHYKCFCNEEKLDLDEAFLFLPLPPDSADTAA